MRLSFSRAATAAVLGCTFASGCATKSSLPASPVAAPLSDVQAIALAEDYLDERQPAEPSRYVASVEPTGDGNLVSFRTRFDAGGEPPVQSRLVMVKHDGGARELQFRRGD